MAARVDFHDHIKIDDDETERLVAAAQSDPSNPEKWELASKRLQFWHGTSWKSAQKIYSEGFRRSQDGLLGPGVYVARRDKALKFAQNSERHGGTAGGLLKVVVSFSNPKVY